MINQGIFASLQTINSFPSERALALRERAAGTYHVSAYVRAWVVFRVAPSPERLPPKPDPNTHTHTPKQFLAKTVAECAFLVVPPVLFSAIVYHLVGLDADATKFWVFTGFMILCQLSATSLATMVSTLARTTDFSMVILPMFFELGRLFGGFFLPPAQLPQYFVWLDALCEWL